MSTPAAISRHSIVSETIKGIKTILSVPVKQAVYLLFVLQLQSIIQYATHVTNRHTI